MNEAWRSAQLAVALAAALLFSAPPVAWAQDANPGAVWEIEQAIGNAAVITQGGGPGNTVSVEQSAAAGYVDGYASSALNTAIVTQEGAGNAASLSQYGTANDIGLLQSGVNNQAAIVQSGTQRQADVQQSGNDLSISIDQHGYGYSQPIVIRQH